MCVTTGAVLVTVATAGAAIPAAITAGTATASAAGVTVGATFGGTIGGTAAGAIINGSALPIVAVAGAGAAGAVMGGIAGGVAGCAVGAPFLGAAVGAGVGAATGVAIASSTAGAVGLAKIGLSSGNIGWCVLGADEFTFDCWKKVVHDTSQEPSQGKILNEFVKDNRIKHVLINSSTECDYPELTLVNIWNEQFKVEFYYLPSLNQIVAHARSIEIN